MLAFSLWYLKNICIIYNGEIYNYKEIRLELENLGLNFETKTDTEVLLKAFKIWGHECLEKLNGMFSFCIYDTDRNTISIYRDAFGIKPLYYYLDNSKFIFSS